MRSVSAEADRARSEANRVSAEGTRDIILDAVQSAAESLDATAAQMKTVEDMRQALYKLIKKPIDKRQ